MSNNQSHVYAYPLFGRLIISPLKCQFQTVTNFSTSSNQIQLCDDRSCVFQYDFFPVLFRGGEKSKLVTTQIALPAASHRCHHPYNVRGQKPGEASGKKENSIIEDLTNSAWCCLHEIRFKTFLSGVNLLPR